MKKAQLLKLICLLLLVSALRINAQTPSSTKIYMPLDIRQAYENGTRTYNGLPGNNYWQNTCKYKIHVDVNPYTRELKGKEWIVYSNNSPDTLKKLFLHTYQDVYKKGSQRIMDIGQETEGIILDYIIINGDTLNERNYFQLLTFIYVYRLEKFLNPNSDLNIEISWRVRMLENAIIREGFVDSTSAFIGLWYPKIAVYDDVFGYNADIYNFNNEFYSLLSSYDVSISLPKGFLVWSTGTLQNPEKYPKIIIDRLNSSNLKTSIESIIDSTTILNPDEFGKNPWHFIADSVPDFAFGISDHYLWDATILEINNKKVLINAVYPKNQLEISKDAIKIIKDAIKVYSENIPGILFPYPNYTSFRVTIGGGMEYPMISFNGDLQSVDLNAMVEIHEMLHSYVPFYLRTNEAKFAWIDEGLTDFYSTKVLKALNYNIEDWNNFKEKNLEPNIKGFGNLPLFTSSNYTDQFNWGGMMFIKTPQMLISLEDLLGSEVWPKCFVSFVKTWKYKSPTTYDFIFFVENYTKQDLFWFWDKWFMHFGYPDLSIKKVTTDRVILDNIGGLPIPFSLQTTDENGKQNELKFHADSWSKDRIFEIKLSTTKLSKIELKCDLVNDYNLKDNIWSR